MPMTVLSIAYPLAPVGPDAVGGAEQILHTIDQGLVARGYQSIVIACEGSRVAGRLVSTPAGAGPLSPQVRRRALECHRHTVAEVLSRWPVDVVHLHGHDFDRYLPPAGPPALATIHLPPELLLARLTRVTRLQTWAHGVSRAQQVRLPHVPFLLPPIENGVDVPELPRRVARRRFTLALGRVCPEKGFHLALDAAKRARSPLLLGGTVFPYPEHRQYFEREMVPRLDRDRRFLGPLSLARKRRLLSAARSLLVPSLAPETSSLVTMEALSCGTPVIAFRIGALPDLVEHGVTGFLVRDVEEMAEAIDRAGAIDPEACRVAARRRFSAARMVDRYLRRYEWMLSAAQHVGNDPSSD